MDSKALYRLGYGLYVLTAKDNGRDNGCIINTLLQVTSGSAPLGVITVNKQNYTHDMIMNSKNFNVSVLDIKAPFEVFTHFGFQSGKTVDKISGYSGVMRSKNGLVYLSGYTNAFVSFEVIDTIDFGSHTMFKSAFTDGEVLSFEQSVTYSYYQQHIKPRPAPDVKNCYRCSVCGYVYEGEELPEGFTCPVCKHGIGDFIKATV